MKASEMTNEELANELDNVLVNDELQTFAEVDRQIEALHEAAARLRKPCAKNYKCDSLEEMLSAEKRKNADLLRRFKAAEDALKKCAKVQCDGYDDSISCEECDLSCDGRCAQWTAKNALSLRSAELKKQT